MTVSRSSAAKTRPDLARILFAVSEFEHRTFFRSRAVGELTGEHGQWYRTEEKSPETWEKIWRDFAPTVLVSGWSTPMIPDAVAHDPQNELAYVCHATGSIRQLVPRALMERGLLVTNWGALASRPVAEHALLLILSSLRHTSRWRPHLEKPLKERNRVNELPTRTLFKRTVGLHGFGKIARELIALLRPFQVNILAYSAGVPAAVMEREGVTPCASLEELFRSSEILVECEALTPETTQSVTRRVLEQLPSGAIFVNVGRGLVVDEAALMHLAREGRIQLGLDVFAREPVLHDSPLLTIPDAILSPHIAGPTTDLYPECGDHALENLRAYLAGEPLDSVITLDIYDRST